MGSLCSKPSAYSGGHQVLGGAEGGRPVGGPTSNLETAEERRARAAAAADQRRLDAKYRGTNTSNPKHGQLAESAAKPFKPMAEASSDEPPLRWD